MGVYVRYCAIPPSSTLFRRLQSEQAFATLMGTFFHCGGGIFTFFDEADRFTAMISDDEVRERMAANVMDVIAQVPPEHREEASRLLELPRLRELSALMHQSLEETLDETINRYREVLGPEPEARRLIDEFRRELERTRSAHPGIEGRMCSLENSSRVIEQRLQDQFVAARGTGTWKFVVTLMFGDQKLGGDLPRQDGFRLGGDRLGLVSPPLVREAAQALGPLDPEALFARDGATYLDDFLRWRRLYQAAATEGEALLVG